MLKISEFARIGHVSTQTLRYYAAEGLLCPDVVDPVTGYRFYAPEKIETLHRIQTYKNAGFSLEEIKELLSCDVPRQDVMISKKREEIHRSMKNLRGQLSRLESLSSRKKPLELRDIFTKDAAFEDHPEVLGIWELCGRLTVPADAPFPDYTAPLEASQQEDVFERLVFLQGGTPWWRFCWSRGVLYWISDMPRGLLPNPYRVWETERGRYMTVRYYTMASINRFADPIWLLYRQTKHVALSEEESHLFVDETNLPTVPDPDVIGTWESVALTWDPDTFTRQEIPKSRTDLWILELTFTAENTCIRRVTKDDRAVDWILSYTRYDSPDAEGQGAILNPGMRLAETYRLRDVDGIVFLFVQHKSGDYIYGGRKPIWYVFRRAAV